MKFPFVQILTLLFVTLKLTGFIDWSWWWIWSPIYIPALIASAFFIFVWGMKNG